MLDPCNPCLCYGAPCEQCIFGYQSAEDKHDMLKKLIDKTIRGEKPNGYLIAERYMSRHENWSIEMDCDLEEKPTVEEENKGMLLTGILVKCERCCKEEFFADRTKRGDSDVVFHASKWMMLENKHICPDCARDYKAIIETFFG